MVRPVRTGFGRALRSVWWHERRHAGSSRLPDFWTDVLPQSGLKPLIGAIRCAPRDTQLGSLRRLTLICFGRDSVARSQSRRRRMPTFARLRLRALSSVGILLALVAVALLTVGPLSAPASE